jgi:2,4-dienoyl-CoA reductase-like NADH-dependent reductase (Old Yellow Enzyme family)
MSNLHQPVRIGAWELANRIVMAPLTRCRASDGRVPNALMADYGRLFIANPDLVERLAADAPLNEPDPSSF